MDKSEFVEWLKYNTSFEQMSDFYWRELMNYAECIYDELTIETDNSVTLTYENWFFGGSETITKTFSFDEFVSRYNNGELKN